jgi:hypothetical protein
MRDDDVIDRATLRDWIENDSLEHLLHEGYLGTDANFDPGDDDLKTAVSLALEAWKAYDQCARMIYALIDEAGE